MTTGNKKLYVDWDNNLDFSDATEDLTDVTLNITCARGRDYASQLTGRSTAGQLRATINNESGDYSSFNTASAIAGNIVPGRKVQLCASDTQPLVSVSVTKAIAAAGDYAAEDVLSESTSVGTAWTFADVALVKGEALSIVKAQAICEVTGLTPRLTLYLFTVTPTCAMNDNVANTALLHADIANYIGKIDFPSLEDLGGDSEAIATPSTYGNLPLEFNCASTDTDIYGVIITRDAIAGEVAGMDVTITLTVERANNPLWTGYLQSIKPYPSATGLQTVELVAIGPLGYLNQRETEVAMQTTIATGAEITEILDKAAWPGFPRTLDTGQTTMDRFWQDKVKTLTALRKVEGTESGFLAESAAGYIVFEDRHHRMKSPHLTSQATYTDAPGGAIGYIRIGQEDPLQQIFNIFEAEVKTYTAGSSATLWTCPESGASSPQIPAGDNRTFWASYPNSDSATNALAVDAWTTPESSVDFVANTAADGSGTNITASVTIAETKFSNAMKMVVTNAATQNAYLTTFQARGTPITVSDPMKVRVEDSTSKTAYGERTYPHPGEFIPDTVEAKDWCDFNISVYKDPQPILLIALHSNRSHSHLVEALTRDISDRITLVANNSSGLGINQDFFIETIYHEMKPDSHKVTFALSPAGMWGQFWVWDTATWDNTTKWAY